MLCCSACSSAVWAVDLLRLDRARKPSSNSSVTRTPTSALSRASSRSSQVSSVMPARPRTPAKAPTAPPSTSPCDHENAAVRRFLGLRLHRRVRRHFDRHGSFDRLLVNRLLRHRRQVELQSFQAMAGGLARTLIAENEASCDNNNDGSECEKDPDHAETLPPRQSLVAISKALRQPRQRD